jgi:hypothetical protein
MVSPLMYIIGSVSFFFPLDFEVYNYVTDTDVQALNRGHLSRNLEMLSLFLQAVLIKLET